jgi:hypothetical protein
MHPISSDSQRRQRRSSGSGPAACDGLTWRRRSHHRSGRRRAWRLGCRGWINTNLTDKFRVTARGPGSSRLAGWTQHGLASWSSSMIWPRRAAGPDDGPAPWLSCQKAHSRVVVCFDAAAVRRGFDSRGRPRVVPASASAAARLNTRKVGPESFASVGACVEARPRPALYVNQFHNEAGSPGVRQGASGAGSAIGAKRWPCSL